MITINSEFLSLYEKLEGTLFTNYLRVTEKSSLNKAEAELTAIAFETLDELDKEVADKYDAMKLPSRIEEPVFKVCHFIVLAGLSSYYGLCNLDHLGREKDEDASFGYKGAFDGLKPYCAIRSKNSSEVQAAALTRLESSLRDCSSSEYMAQEKYVDDIKWVYKMMQSKPRFNGSDEELDAVEALFGSQIDLEVDKIVTCYASLLEADFSLEKYKGVFTFDKASPVVGLDSSYTRKIIEPSRTFMEYYMPVLRRHLSCVVPSEGIKMSDGSTYYYSDRQFDCQAIYNGFESNKARPVYFPAKVLELISLSRWSCATKANVYAPCTKGENVNLEAYTRMLGEEFSEDIAVYCHFLCIVALEKLRSTENNKTLDLLDILDNMDSPYHAWVKSFVADRLSYYTQCVTTAVVLADLDTGKKINKRGTARTEILSFRIKVLGQDSPVSNEAFCSELAQLIYNDASGLSDAESSALVQLPAGAFLQDYAYTFDADKVYARPVFAYKALDAMRAQNRQLGWSNILLGKYADGSLCTSGNGSKIHMQKNNLHSIYAGSRSGKGVMGFNIFATAIASGLPIFYFDRKPDTAVVMSSLCKDMFAVNGGQYSSGMDLENMFNPKSFKVQIPSYLESYFDTDEVIADFAYFRGFMLFWCLVNFAEQNKGKDARADKIVSMLKGGAVVVLDEFTNYVSEFLSKKPVVGGSGWFSASECYSPKGIGEFANKAAELVSLKSKVDKAKDKASKLVAQSNLSAKMASLKNSYKLSALYFAQVAEMYSACLAAGPKWFRSGGTFSKAVQIFVIGQEIPIDYYDSNLEFKPSANSTGKFNASRHKVGSSDVLDIPWVASLKNMGGDFIFGYQPDGTGKPSYLAQRERGMITSSMLTASRRCFCYYNPSQPQGYSDLLKITDTKNAFNGNTAEMNKFLTDKFIYFKPFLILNNANEPPEDVRYSPSSPVPEELANKRKGVVADEGSSNAGAYLQSQYVGQCLTSCNNAGLSWDDLLSDNDDGSGHLRSEIGFEGYIRALCGTVPTDKLAMSGKAMNILVQEVLGYDGDWRDFLFDFRPEALFTPQMFDDIVAHPDTASVKSRLSSTFFADDLLQTNAFGEFSFAELYKKELGSLYPYYAVSDAEPVVASSSSVGVVPAMEFKDELSSFGGAKSNSESYSEPEQVSRETSGVSNEKPTFREILAECRRVIFELDAMPNVHSIIIRKGGADRVATAIALYYAKMLDVPVN